MNRKNLLSEEMKKKITLKKSKEKNVRAHVINQIKKKYVNKYFIEMENGLITT